MLPGTTKKALLWGAFLFLGVSAAYAQCERPAGAREVRVSSVVDGDTVYLKSGESVRLIGVNTPELGVHGNEALQYWAHAAELRLQGLKQRIRYLVPGGQPRDRYGRALAHLYLDDGRSVEGLLLAEGLGFYIAIPPNLRLRDCLLVAELSAREAGLGVWQLPVRTVEQVLAMQNPAGFHLLSGIVTESADDRTAAQRRYITLNGKVSLKFGESAAGSASVRALRPGDRVEVRGWLVDRGASSRVVTAGFPRWLINISHQDHIKRIP